MKKLLTVAALVLSLGLAGCAGTGPGPEPTADDARAAIAAAKAATAKVKKVLYEWRDTGKMIKKAEAALASGDIAKAIKLAKKAERQSLNAWAQYEREKNAGPHS